VARWVYETYCRSGGKVWDPCSGYGGRLLGAFAAGVRYVATDVEPETVEGNRRLAERLGFTDAEIHECPAERFDPGTVDLVFTSPPYFDREQYSDRDGQSWVSHGSDFDAWVEGFLRPVIATAYQRSPVLVLNVADIRKNRKSVPLVDRTIQTAVAEGYSLKERVWMPLARLNRTPEKAREPLLVFRR
jgi:tRNA G10  N-methylase Trm11